MRMNKLPADETQREIEKNLKLAYDEVMQQEVPDRFTSLLAQLKEAESAKQGGDKSGGDSDDG